MGDEGNTPKILYSSPWMQHAKLNESFRYHIGEDGPRYKYASEISNDLRPTIPVSATEPFDDANGTLSKSLKWSICSLDSSLKAQHCAISEKDTWAYVVPPIIREPGNERISPYDLAEIHKHAPSRERGR